MCDKIYKHNKISSIAVFSATFMIIAAIFLFLSVKNVRAEDEKDYKNVYINQDTGYEAIIEDDAALMSENDYEALLGPMKQITLYGNVMLKTIETNNMSTEGYIRALYNERFKSDSGTILVIDMDNRNIWIHSNGKIYNTVTSSYADTITDNVYRYASSGDYYTCAYKVFEQELALLKGSKISQPIKYISNAAVVLWFNPVSDIYYYAAVIVELIAIIYTVTDLIRYYNMLATRKLPQFDNYRGGDDNV